LWFYESSAVISYTSPGCGQAGRRQTAAIMHNELSANRLQLNRRRITDWTDAHHLIGWNIAAVGVLDDHLFLGSDAGNQE
jgi:hypothetical protein